MAETEKFLSTLSLRRATQQFHRRLLAQVISIHALLAESDHSPHFLYAYIYRFLSTLSLRRATPLQPLFVEALKFLSTLSLRRATLAFLALS